MTTDTMITTDTTTHEMLLADTLAVLAASEPDAVVAPTQIDEEFDTAIVAWYIVYKTVNPA